MFDKQCESLWDAGKVVQFELKPTGVYYAFMVLGGNANYAVAVDSLADLQRRVEEIAAANEYDAPLIRSKYAQFLLTLQP